MRKLGLSLYLGMPKEKRPVQDSLHRPFCFFVVLCGTVFPNQNDAERRPTNVDQLAWPISCSRNLKLLVQECRNHSRRSWLRR